MFRQVFIFPKTVKGQEIGVYGWDDQIYRDFMITLFQNMEPLMLQQGEILYQELQSVEEIIFMQRGQVDVGFCINRKPKMVLRVNKGTIFGAYHCSFNRKTMFHYQCHTQVEGYMVRKDNWFDIIEDYEEIAGILNNNVRDAYN